MFHSLLCLWFFIFLVSLTIIDCRDVVVDTSLKIQNGSSYPSLHQAISALLNGTLLIDQNNTIMLKANCLERTHFFPQTEITGIVEGKTGGQLNISYENIPININESTCDQLPTLSLSNNSYFNVNGIESVRLSGFSFQSFENPQVNSIGNMAAFTISNFCFTNKNNVSDQSNSFVSNENPSLFKIFDLEYFLMENGIFFYDPNLQISISQVSSASFRKLVLFNMLSQTPTETLATNNSLFNISSDSYDNGNVQISDVKISDFMITCGEGFLPMPAVMSVEGVTDVSISSMNVTNCNFNSFLSFPESKLSLRQRSYKLRCSQNSFNRSFFY